MLPFLSRFDSGINYKRTLFENETSRSIALISYTIICEYACLVSVLICEKYFLLCVQQWVCLLHFHHSVLTFSVSQIYWYGKDGILRRGKLTCMYHYPYIYLYSASLQKSKRSTAPITIHVHNNISTKDDT